MRQNTQNASTASRRNFLKSIGGGSVGLALGSGLGLAACSPKSPTQDFSGDYSAMAQLGCGVLTEVNESVLFRA